MLDTIGTRVFPSVKLSTLTSGPSRYSSITTRAPLSPKARSSIAGALHGLNGLLARHGHHHALAERQAVGLDHDGQGRALNVFERSRRVVKYLVGGGGYAVLLHEVLGKDLAALYHSRALFRPEAGYARGLQRVHHAEAERVVRRDHGVVYLVLPGIGHGAVNIRRGHTGAYCVLRDPAVAGQDMYFAGPGAFFERPHNSVFPPTGTYNE